MSRAGLVIFIAAASVLTALAARYVTASSPPHALYRWVP
jgi:hypothetical protein